MRRLLPALVLLVACARKTPTRPALTPDDEPPLTAAESNALLGIQPPPIDAGQSATD